MSKCGYFNIFKGKVSCKHPNYGDDYTKYYGKDLSKKCSSCKRTCGGVYPNQLLRADQSDWKYEVVDVTGKVLMSY